MKNVNWMTLATWSVLVVCVLLAFVWNFVQYNSWREAERQTQAVGKQIASQDLQTQYLQEKYNPVSHSATAPAERQEDAKFLEELRMMMRRSGVRAVSIAASKVAALPLIQAPPASQNGALRPGQSSSGGNTPPPPAPASISNMPLGLRAITQDVTIQGVFPNVYQFLHNLSLKRLNDRTVNINSTRITPVPKKNMVEATVTLTRFVRPVNLETPLTAPGLDRMPAAGAAAPTGSPTESAALR